MKSIDVKILKQMFISAANNLFNHYPEIDALNVFPVPDGDTGINMNLTLTSGAKEIANRNDDNVHDLAHAFSKGLLFGARGNSGVITSQIFRGFANALEGKKEIDLKTLSLAFVSAKTSAYNAVLKPVEGTILTVLRESSDYLAEHSEEVDSVDKGFRMLLIEARNSLKRTPELLPVLKEVGVVDSGGAGYVTILEGMYSALKGKFIEKTQITALKESEETSVLANLDNEEFGYCTEFIMSLGPDTTKKTFNKKRFIQTLSTKGNSMVVVQDEDIVKVHIHTLTPGWVLNYAQQFGEFKKLKIENMTEQHSEIMMTKEEKQNKASSDDNVPLKDYGLIAVAPGEGIAEMFKEIGVHEIVSGGQTMNPSTEDFVEAIKKVHAKKVFIFPNNSNIVLAASQACDVISEEIDARVIPCSTIPQGIVAAMNFSEEEEVNNNFQNMKGSLKTVRSASITYAIKDTEIDGVKVYKDQYMALVDKKIIACVKDKFDALFISLDAMVKEESSIITIFTGNDITDVEISELEDKLEEKFDFVDIDLRKGDQPVYSFIVGVE